MAFYDITGTIMALLLWLDSNGDLSRSVFDRTKIAAAHE